MFSTTCFPLFYRHNVMEKVTLWYGGLRPLKAESKRKETALSLNPFKNTMLLSIMSTPTIASKLVR